VIDRGLYRQLEKYPSEVIPIFDLAIMDLLSDKVGHLADENGLNVIQIAPYNLERKR
jgi:hypothetical protein